MNVKQAWLDIYKQILSITKIDYFDFIECAENKYLEIKLIIFMIKKKIFSLLSTNDIQNSLEEFEKRYLIEKTLLKKENYELLVKIESLINENEIFESYSNMISVIINSYMTFSSITNHHMYSWKNFLFILKSIFVKSLREISEQM